MRFKALIVYIDVSMARRQKNLKKILLIIAIVVVACLGFAYLLYTHPFWANMATDQTDSKADCSQQFGIKPYISDTDADGDGIDDQTDMLQSARDYVATKPKYKSRYYGDTGYPDDGYGVCTDVVAFACKGSGYDLMALVAEDVEANKEAYGIEEPNEFIDFRRVENLNVYFSRNARTLTTDLSEIEQWQGGDIVVFGWHIAMVSDKRNEKGIPYIIHHESPVQESYEEDALELWQQKAGIIGHYRIGEPDS